MSCSSPTRRTAPGAVRLPPDVRTSRAHAGALGRAQRQRRLLRRDRALRVLRRPSTGKAATASTTMPARSTATTRAASTRLSRCSSRSEAASPPTVTSTAPRTSPSGREPTRIVDRTRSTTGRRSRSRARSSTAANYSRVAFEADLPRIEAADFGGNCDRFSPARQLREPTAGLELLPDLHHGILDRQPERERPLRWQFGGPYLKGTTNTFGGNSATEFGPLLFSFYPTPNPATRLRTNNFRNILSSNPCPA